MAHEYIRPQLQDDMGYKSRPTPTEAQWEDLKAMNSPRLISDIYASITGRENSDQVLRPIKRSE